MKHMHLYAFTDELHACLCEFRRKDKLHIYIYILICVFVTFVHIYVCVYYFPVFSKQLYVFLSNPSSGRLSDTIGDFLSGPALGNWVAPYAKTLLLAKLSKLLGIGHIVVSCALADLGSTDTSAKLSGPLGDLLLFFVYIGDFNTCL